MADRRREEEQVPDDRRTSIEEPAAAPALPAPFERVLAMQRTAGNTAVRGVLARHGVHGAPEAGTGTGTAPAPGLTQAGQETEARDTWALLRAVHQQMLASTDTRIRNTGQMLNPPAERDQGRRMSVRPMTLRSDSAQLVADRGDNAAETAYFFYGSHQDNEHRHGPTTMGTIEGGSTVLVRGKLASGTWQPRDDLMGTLVHECSHILVADYGEHPGTSTDAGSFDRYRDEFRAYFVEPHGGFAGLTGAARAAAIKTHLVGTSATTGGYPDLRAAYWAGTAATNTFRQQVDAHTAPDGFNLNNSPYLDRLVELLREQRAGRATVEQTVFHVMLLEPAERQEAAGATLTATLLSRLPAADAARIRRALASPSSVAFGRELNPNGSPRVTAFLEAVTARSPDQIVETYRLCNPQDRADLHFNEHFLSWVFRAIPSEQLLRTCTICVVTGRSFAYFDRVREFARACTAAAGAAAMPEALRTALRSLSLDVRMGYYRFCEDDYRTRVLPLQEPVRREVTAILRGDSEP